MEESSQLTRIIGCSMTRYDAEMILDRLCNQQVRGSSPLAGSRKDKGSQASRLGTLFALNAFYPQALPTLQSVGTDFEPNFLVFHPRPLQANSPALKSPFLARFRTRASICPASPRPGSLVSSTRAIWEKNPRPSVAAAGCWTRWKGTVPIPHARIISPSNHVARIIAGID